MPDRFPLPEPFRCDVVQGDGHVRVVPVGELDMATHATLDRRLRELHESGAAPIVIDLRRLSFMDSSGLRLLLQWDEITRGDGARLSLIQGPREIERVFETTRLLDRLAFVDPPAED